MPKSFSRKRLSAWDRRLAAIHEAGHVTMARYVGLIVTSAWLEETREGGIYEKFWIGHTSYMLPFISKKRISRKKMSMFAVAGTVAERCWHREAFDYDLWFDAYAMSDSDWAGCDCEPGDPPPQLLEIIKTVFSLFDREAGELWPAVVIEARSLIKDSRDAAGTTL